MSTFKQEPELLPACQATLWGYMFASLCFSAWQVYAGLKLSCYLEASASHTYPHRITVDPILALSGSQQPEQALTLIAALNVVIVIPVSFKVSYCNSVYSKSFPRSYLQVPH